MKNLKYIFWISSLGNLIDEILDYIYNSESEFQISRYQNFLFYLISIDEI